MSGMTGGDITTLTGNAGGLIPSSGSGNFNIVGSGTIVVTGTPATHTLTISGGGAVAITNHALAVGTGVTITSLALGTNGTVLTGVTGADPAFSASPTLTTVYATTFDTNVAAAAVTLSGTTLSADGTDVDININITAKGAGKVIIDDLQLTTDLAVTEGGTGVSTLTDHGLLVGSGTAAIDALSVGASGTLLTGVTGADPTWTTATYPSTVAKGDVLVASANNVVGVVNDVVNAGYVLTANAAAAPTFQAIPAPVVGSFASDAETIAGAVTNKAVAPSNLAAKLGSQTLHALPIGAGSTAALNWLAVGANGETLMGSTGADCGWTNSPQFGGSITATNDITSTAGSISSLSGSMISRDATNTSTGPSAYFQKVRVAATIQSGDELGKMRFTGYDGTGYITGAKITSTNSGTVATNRIAGDLQFYTHPDAAVALPSEPTLRMTIASTGATTIASPDSGVGLTVSGGGITCTSGAITATSGNVVISSGNLTLPATTSTVGQIIQNGLTLWHRYGTNNIFIGDQAGNFTLTAQNSTCIGYQAGHLLTSPSNTTLYGSGAGASITSGANNCAFGQGSLAAVGTSSNNAAFGHASLNSATGDSNCGFGFASLYTATSGSYNGAYGLYALGQLGSGSYNLALGYGGAANQGAGFAYTGTESSNICIHNAGTVGESNKIRIGTYGTGNGQQDTAYIAGIVHGTNGLTADTGDIVATSGNLKLPSSSSTVGQIQINSNTVFHTYGGEPGNDAYRNLWVGKDAGNFTCSTGVNYGGNIGIGCLALRSLSNGQENFALGYKAFYALGGTADSGYRNVAIGNYAGYQMTCNSGVFDEGSYNTFIGYGAGGYLNASEYSNIFINYQGVAGQNNRLQLGQTTGSGAGYGKINEAYICGIYGRTPAGTLNVALIDSNNQLGSVASLGVAQGGTGAATLTDHGILLGSGTGAITPLGVATDGQLPIGSSGADPVLATLTAGTGISVTNGAGSISIAATGTILAWAEETGATKTIVVQEAYVANRGTLITFTLPATAALGTEFKIQGKGAGGWKIAQNAGQTIHVGSSASTTGAAGYIASTDTYDAITLVCITADTDWAAESVVGNITVA